MFSKKCTLLFVCLLFAALIFSGCGILEEEAEEVSIINKFVDVEEYLSAPSVRTEIEAQLNAGDSGTRVEVSADGNTLIYSAHLAEQLTASDPKQHGEITKALAESCTANADVYLQLTEDLKTVVDADAIAVRICYYNADGAQLYHCIYDNCSKAESVSARLLQEDMQTALAEEIAALEGTGLSMSVYAADDALVYDCSYSDQLDLSDPAIRAQVEETLAAACSEASATYVGIAAELRSVAHGDNIRVQLIYRNADGSIIYTRTFQ